MHVCTDQEIDWFTEPGMPKVDTAAKFDVLQVAASNPLFTYNVATVRT